MRHRHSAKLRLPADRHDVTASVLPPMGPVPKPWASPLGISSGHQVANNAKTGSGTTGKSRN
ncbi:hypothetical protein EHS39_23485 [Ensifer sp. MPMI2T]|nr:hypothetical protein EHS39_23485 [Ensifer sp. MPMI2T]